MKIRCFPGWKKIRKPIAALTLFKKFAKIQREDSEALVKNPLPLNYHF
jgi:hypothetical protein